jgi:predicted transcriptional regulator
MGGNGQGRQVEQAVVVEIIRMRLRGCSLRTVKAILGVSKQTVAKYAPQRVLNRLREIAPNERGAEIDIVAKSTPPRNGGATPCDLARGDIGAR